MKEADERYSTVEDAIYDAFFLLLKEKSVDRITVSDVVKRDYIPAYGTGDAESISFTGKRIKRGLYLQADGKLPCEE